MLFVSNMSTKTVPALGKKWSFEMPNHANWLIEHIANFYFVFYNCSVCGGCFGGGNGMNPIRFCDSNSKLTRQLIVIYFTFHGFGLQSAKLKFNYYCGKDLECYGSPENRRNTMCKAKLVSLFIDCGVQIELKFYSVFSLIEICIELSGRQIYTNYRWDQAVIFGPS